MCEEKKSSGGCCAKWLCRVIPIIFHIAGMVLAAAAALVMATASQCTVYTVTNYGWSPRTITYRDFPAFVYLVAATSIAALLEAVAMFLSLCKKCGSKKADRVVMALLGAVVPALLYTSAGAAFATGWDIPYYLEPIGRRFSVCRSSVGGGHFCEQVHVSMWLALGAALAVSIAEVLTTLGWCHCGGSGSESGSHSDSDSDSESVCGHGCHCKH